MPKVYYNENDAFCVDWLQSWIQGGILPAGKLDNRDINDVLPSEIGKFSQCHFFAGIGGWAYAAKIANWYGPVWTGSCPCQDFSIIGRRAGFNGNRDLWPTWFKLIAKCKPRYVFGEQVDHAFEWWDRAASDLESAGYACGALVVPAYSVGARHERFRVFFVADANKEGWSDNSWSKTRKAICWKGSAIGVVHSKIFGNFKGPFVPDESWIVDGLRGEGFATGAIGNAIVPQIGAALMLAVKDSWGLEDGPFLR